MNPTNGLLLIDKPTGLTSHDVVYRVRRMLGIRAVGHAGTLDPLASGLLVLLIGEATKVSDYLLNGDKGYEFKVRLGRRTDSMDITGVAIGADQVVTASEDEIRAACLKLAGDLELEVPVHSAVKVDGKKLYEYAHKGEVPETVPSRTMSFYDIEVVSVEPSAVTVRLRCSKGSFIRAWANRLGDELGCGGCIETLRRVLSAPFKVDQAMTLADLESRWASRTEEHGRVLEPAWVPLRDALPHFQPLEIEGKDELLLKNGQISVNMRGDLIRGVQINVPPPPVRVISRETDDLLALLVAAPGEFYKIRRVFHRA